MTSWKASLTTAIAITLTCGAAASAQTPDPTTTDPTATAQATSSQAPGQPVLVPTGQKNEMKGFADRIDITAIPAGALWVTDGRSALQPGFQSYTPGAAFGVRITNYIAVEAETAWAISQRQELSFDGQDVGSFKTPTLFGYTGNVLVNVRPSDRKVVPYGVGGIGGMFLSQRADLGIDDGSNFFIGDVGGGAKIMFGKLGIRGDYRFLMLHTNDDDVSFVGDRTRYGHRVYVGLVIAPGRSTTPGS